MQVILRQTMDNLGEAGSVVNVKDGYARNYLFPRDLAAPATSGMKRQLEHLKRLAEKRRLKELRTAEDLRDRLEITEVEIQARVGEKDKLYGSVTTHQIAEALAAQGIHIDRRKIILEHPIRELGEHTVRIKVDPKVTANLKVSVSGSTEPGLEPLFASERPTAPPQVSEPETETPSE